MSVKKISALFFIFSMAMTQYVMAHNLKPEKPLNWRTLADFLPDLDKWEKKGDLEGSTMKMGPQISQVEQNYTSGDINLKIMIVDAGAFPEFLFPIKMVLQSEIDTSTEYIKPFDAGGHPGAEKYEFNKKRAEIIVLVASRFLLTLTAENLELKATNDLMLVLKLIDIAGLAKLADK
ncbi:MAG: hypothetical protein WBE11_02920 [Candidatus Aminicenantaceae bacterium]